MANHIQALILAARLGCWEALITLVPELKSLLGQSQHFKAGVDVAEHTLLMLSQCPPDDELLLLAAVFHDIGKPVVAQPAPNNLPGYEFPRHALESSVMTTDILSRFEGANNYINPLIYLVVNHMKPHGEDGQPPMVPDYGDREKLVDLAELDSASFAGRSLGKVRERFNKLRVKFNLPERPPVPPQDLESILKGFRQVWKPR
jgi:hypothetical protein